MSASAAEVGRKVICADGWRVTMHIEVRSLIGSSLGRMGAERGLESPCW